MGDVAAPQPDPDPFVAASEEVAVAGRAACEAIAGAVEALEVGAAARQRGVPLIDVVDELIDVGGRRARLAAADAFHDFERAVGELRAGVVGALVDDEQLSMTEVAAHLHISRQAVARLYKQAHGGPPVM